MTFSSEQRSWFEAASLHVDEDALRKLIVEMTAIASPTGSERELAQFLVAELRSAGVDAVYQPIDGNQGNAIARLRGDGSGPELLLYSPIDAHITGDEQYDSPGVDFAGRDDLRVQPVVDGDLVIGLCSENPKGHAACIAMTAIAIARAGIPLCGDIVFGFGAGGMPVNRSPLPAITRANVGQGNGCSYLLEQGLRPDYAVITKPAVAVAYEEVGICWFKITVGGRFDYSGRRGHPASKNPILDAMTVIAGLEAWLPIYTEQNTSGLVAPKGNISAIEAGWPEKPAFIPAACNIYLDIRISPRADPSGVRRQLESALADIRRANPGLEVVSEMILSIPGTSTAPDNWIIESAIRAWESSAERSHVFRTGTSGATDANILRGRGIPTARIGMPPVDSPYADHFSMGVVRVSEMARLTRSLAAIAIDTCTRTRIDISSLQANR